jgi:hypothetical protein
VLRTDPWRGYRARFAPGSCTDGPEVNARPSASPARALLSLPTRL